MEDGTQWKMALMVHLVLRETVGEASGVGDIAACEQETV